MTFNKVYGLVCVRAPGSHRRYRKAQGVLGFKPQGYYGWNVRGCYWFLTEADLEKIRQHGATRSRIDLDTLSRCWSDPPFEPTQPYETP